MPLDEFVWIFPADFEGLGCLSICMCYCLYFSDDLSCLEEFVDYMLCNWSSLD